MIIAINLNSRALESTNTHTHTHTHVGVCTFLSRSSENVSTMMPKMRLRPMVVMIIKNESL